MDITTIDVHGIMAAMHAMRNPMNSWDRSDTYLGLKSTTEIKDGLPLFKMFDPEEVMIGPKDKELSMRLQKAGPEHCKHLRMIMCWANIKAPRYWWQEFDTYRHGVEKVSCSTMHKLMSRPLEEGDFEFDDDNTFSRTNIRCSIDILNGMMKTYEKANSEVLKKDLWRAIIQNLPQSYIQERTVMMSYAALRNIVKQREGHKLKEWMTFIDWAHTLPESWMIFDE